MEIRSLQPVEFRSWSDQTTNLRFFNQANQLCKSGQQLSLFLLSGTNYYWLLKNTLYPKVLAISNYDTLNSWTKWPLRYYITGFLHDGAQMFIFYGSDQCTSSCSFFFFCFFVSFTSLQICHCLIFFFLKLGTIKSQRWSLNKTLSGV